jgi:hypothetical protein
MKSLAVTQNVKQIKNVRMVYALTMTNFTQITKKKTIIISDHTKINVENVYLLKYVTKIVNVLINVQ